MLSRVTVPVSFSQSTSNPLGHTGPSFAYIDATGPHRRIPELRSSLLRMRKVDTGRTHSWQVRICCDGDWHRTFFSDSKFESKQAPYEAAVEHRHEVLEDLPDLPEGAGGLLHTPEVHERRWKTRTRTGVKGLGFTMTMYSRASDEKRPYITAHWPGTDRWYSTSFSVVKHGLRGALTEAAETLAAHTDHSMTVDEMIEKALPAVARLLENKDVDVARLNT